MVTENEHSFPIFKEKMVRNTLAVVIGIVIGVVLIALGEATIHVLFPIGKIPTEPEELAHFMENVPTVNKAFLVINWGIAAFIAATVTTLIQGRKDFKPVLITVGILQLLTYMNMLMVPGHPAWIWLSVTFMYVIIGFIAYRLLRKKHVETNEY